MNFWERFKKRDYRAWFMIGWVGGTLSYAAIDLALELSIEVLRW